MKKLFSFLIIFYFLFQISNFSSAQVGEWVWLRGAGNNTYNSPGSFGTMGVASPTNDPPALYEMCEWTDNNGKYWMYGGLDDNPGIHIHNVMWKYDPGNNEWTWMNGPNTLNDHGNFGTKGVPSPTNQVPGLSYGLPTWTDLNGNLWMFGGWDDSTYADMWEYNISTNIWTWMNGPGTGNPPGIYGTQGVPNAANYPPPRTECAASWVDAAGDLWMFGGYVGQLYNDMWRYNIASNTWTWMKGSSTPSTKGNFGTKGVEAASNAPSARRAYCHWKDNDGNFWTFGGDGLDSTGSSWYLCDLWRFNPITNNWTWMNGNPVGSNAYNGVFGTKCVTANTNEPPPRFENRAAWTDPNGNFWLFGGFYQTSPFNSLGINDMWMYCVTSNQWTFEAGGTTPNVAGNWGTMGVASPTNLPASRTGNPGWTDGKGNLYTWGGSAATAFGSMYNDLWKFTIDTACYSPCASIVNATKPAPNFQSSETAFCSGNCINYSDLSTNNPTSWQWSFPGATPPTSTDENPQGICYYSSGQFDATLIASNGGGSNSLTFTNYINVFAAPPTPTITCSNDTLYSSFDPSYTTYQWYQNDSLVPGATNSYYSFTENGNYNVAVSNENGCSIAVGITTTGCLTGLPNIFANHTVTLYPNPATDKLLITGYPETGKNTVNIYNVLGESIYKEEINGEQEVINCKSFSAGVYFILISNDAGRWVGRFVKQ